MRELESNRTEDVKVHAERQVKKEPKLLASFRPQPGHTLYELNLETAKITPAVFNSVDAVFKPKTGQTAVKKKLIVNPSCLYACALNVKNADKKFRKMIVKLTNQKQ